MKTRMRERQCTSQKPFKFYIEVLNIVHGGCYCPKYIVNFHVALCIARRVLSNEPRDEGIKQNTAWVLFILPVA